MNGTFKSLSEYQLTLQAQLQSLVIIRTGSMLRDCCSFLPHCGLSPQWAWRQHSRSQFALVLGVFPQSENQEISSLLHLTPRSAFLSHWGGILLKTPAYLKHLWHIASEAWRNSTWYCDKIKQYSLFHALYQGR